MANRTGIVRNIVYLFGDVSTLFFEQYVGYKMEEKGGLNSKVDGDGA